MKRGLAFSKLRSASPYVITCVPAITLGRVSLYPSSARFRGIIIFKQMRKIIKNHKGGRLVEENQEQNRLAQNTLDKIPSPSSNARSITGLVKKSGKVTGYRLSDDTVMEKEQAIQLARQGGIAGVGIAHRGNTEYLKSVPDSSDSNNLSNLPSVTPSDRT